MQAAYWRLIDNGRASVSSFDHQQKYGLPAVFDALHDKDTGDLLFEFTGDIKLQVLNFTGYEVWEIESPNGTGE